MSDPLRITRVEIENFRGIEKLDLNFTDGQGHPLDRVVLIGPNGSGKTAVLEAIKLSRDVAYGWAAPSVISNEIRFGAGRALITVYFGRETIFAATGGGSSPPRAHFSPALAERLRSPRWLYRSSERTPEAFLSLKQNLIALFVQAVGEGHAPEEDSDFRRLESFWRHFSGDSRQLTVMKRGGDGPDASELEVLLRDEEPPLPRDIKSYRNAYELTTGGGHRVISRHDVPAMVPLDRLSSGQKELLSLAGTLLFRDHPLDVLLIDEPEKHLHAEWHFHLLGELQKLSPTTQIIVATHSADIFESVLEEEQIVLDRIPPRPTPAQDAAE